MQAVRSPSFRMRWSFIVAPPPLSIAIEFLDGRYNGVELFFGQLRVNRKRQDFSRGPLALGAGAFGIAEIREARLKMERQWVVDVVSDSVGREVGGQLVSARYAQRVLVVDRHVSWFDDGRTDFSEPSESGIVIRRVATTRGAPSLEMRQLDQKHGCLKSVEAAVVSHFFMVVSL